MYLWVILATFLAVIASYSLAPRADMREVVVEPLAQSELGKFIIQQRAAIEYVNANSKAATDTGLNDYNSGLVDLDFLQDYYVPHGYELTEGYNTQIFCMNSDMTAELEGGDEGPCNEPGGRNMLLTYGPIPERWVNLATEPEEPNADFINAMRSMARGNEVVAYTVIDGAPADDATNPSESDVLLFDGKMLKRSYVPKGVLENIEYQKICDMNANKVCLISMREI